MSHTKELKDRTNEIHDEGDKFEDLNNCINKAEY